MKENTKKSVIYTLIVTGFILQFSLIFQNWMKTEDVIVSASYTPVLPTIAPEPTKSILKPQIVETDIVVKISHYSPALGGVNCLTFKNGKCMSKLANGEDWEKYINTKSVIACPKELKLGTKIKILGRTWTCKDRGSKIVKTEDGKYWVDMLTPDTVVAFGTEVDGKIIN